MKIRVGTTTYDVEVTETGSSSYRVTVDGHSYNVKVPREDVPGRETSIEEDHQARMPGEEDTAFSVAAPLPGKVTAIEVRPGEAVTKGQSLVILESMKMNVPVKAPRSAKVKKISVSMGQSLMVGQEVAVLE